MEHAMSEMLTGAVAMGFLVVTLFFLRFWRESRDRLFAFFALSFLILAVNRFALGVAADTDLHGDYLYWIRLLAFAVILVAIVDKNRPRPPH
jgi:hypothetical protein